VLAPEFGAQNVFVDVHRITTKEIAHFSGRHFRLQPIEERSHFVDEGGSTSGCLVYDHD